MLRRLLWLAVLVGGSVLADWAGPRLRGAGGPVLLAARLLQLKFLILGAP